MKKIFAAVVSAAALSGSLFADGVEFKDIYSRTSNAVGIGLDFKF